jgi:hypothetical protein
MLNSFEKRGSCGLYWFGHEVKFGRTAIPITFNAIFPLPYHLSFLRW